MKLQTTIFLPDYLKALPNWTLRKGKIPYSANYNGMASSTNKDSWCSYEKAYNSYQMHKNEYDGLEFAINLESNLIFIDIDHCINDGVMDIRATDIIDSLNNQYIEISQSGTGIHILAIGKIPKGFKNSKNGIEFYNDKRFIALTGNAIFPNEPHLDNDSIMDVYNRYCPREEPKNFRPSSQCICTETDKAIVSKAMEKSPKFPSLYGGNWQEYYSSQSEADLSLCNILAYWCDCDLAMMDRIFRASGLYREKWNRDDYRNKTLQTAIGSCKETRSETIKRKHDEEMKNFEREFISRW